ncbi:AfsR/SARP family transcriptional regulator [Amycolatopsis pithecellobii]|nr:AfsR/SARP family transcriptional regulator [Amycolatopsis pithecellobii]
MLTAPKVEKLLAVLLVRSGRPTSISQLIDEIWLSEPPRRAVPALHVYISQLRKFLARAGAAETPVVTRSPGYLFEPADEDDSDFREFERLAAKGSELAKAGFPAGAVDAYRRALALWRGPVLGDAGGGPILRGFGTWLNELRLQCIATMVTCGMELGQHLELVPLLRQTTLENPLNEIYYQQLMLVLYRCGRRAEALEVYRELHRTLRMELGIEPGRAVAELHQRIMLAESGEVSPDMDCELLWTATAGIGVSISQSAANPDPARPGRY